MSSRSIKMTVPLNGISKGERKPVFEAEGFVGTSCTDATQAFEQALGGQEEQTIKDEYYQTEERQEFLNEGGDS